MTAYQHTDRDLLETREHYFYSALHGPGFLGVYLRSRRAVLDALPAGGAYRSRTAIVGFPAAGEAVDTNALLDALEAQADPAWIEKLVQRFEVTKRIHALYDCHMRKPEGDYTDLSRYARLALLLARNVEISQDLKYLSTLLKLNDLICSQSPARRASVAAFLHDSLNIEIAAIESLMSSRETIVDA